MKKRSQKQQKIATRDRYTHDEAKKKAPRKQQETTISREIILASSFGFVLFAIISIAMPNNLAFATDCNVLDCNEGGAAGIWNTIKIIINILTVAAGILAAAGITVVGIQYLTAGGNEEKTRKAKRRMLEIVIGLALYVTLNSVINWLLPGGTTSPESGSGGSSQTQTQTQTPAQNMQNVPMTQ